MCVVLGGEIQNPSSKNKQLHDGNWCENPQQHRWRSQPTVTQAGSSTDGWDMSRTCRDVPARDN